ncbi:hypothetical protein AB0O34_29280 [Sphaerisporangium sp. NPDC088356]|uniref:divisome protein SepX/GlpR n=1 Tax=Sphaerisporangium sp. NPDC088356 TaxID=3154871 RepID=UPI00341D1D36
MSSAFLYLGIVLMWLCVLVPMWLRRDRNSVEIAELYNEGEESDGDTLADLQVSEVPSGHAALATDTADDEITMELGTPEPRAESGSPASSHAASQTRAEPDARAVPHGSSKPGAPSPASDISGSRAAGGASAEKASDGSSAAETEPDPVPEELSDEDLFQAECRRRARVLARRRRWLLWTVLLHLASVVTAAVGVAPWWSVAPSAVLLVSYLAVLRVAVAADAERRVEAAKARAERDRRVREHQRALEEAAQQAEAEIIEFRRRVEPFDQYADRSRRAVGD